MVRANANSTSAPDVAHDLLWERVSQREQRRIESRFAEYLGADLICEIESAQAAGTPEKLADLGRWVAASWLSYRNEQLDRLESQETLR
jgi:hypothetical protein